MKHIHVPEERARGVASDPQPADGVIFHNQSGRNARVKVRGYPPGPTPPPEREVEIPPPPEPPLPNNDTKSAPITPPANLVKYSAEAQYDNDPSWVPCAPDLELPESRKTITVTLKTGDEVEWQAE